MSRPKNDDVSSLSHTKWNCLYHIVFAPKYRRKAIYAKLRADIGKYLRRLCEYKGVEIVEAHAMPDHIHMLVKIPPKISVSSFMGYLKGKGSLVIFDEHANGAILRVRWVTFLACPSHCYLLCAFASMI